MKHALNKTLVFVAPSVLVLAVALFLYVILFRQIGASTDRARLAKDIVQAEASTQSQSASLRAEYQATADQRSRLTGLFVPSGGEVSFIEALESLGPASGTAVSISSISADPLDKASSGTVGAISADVSARGSWAAVMKALVLAESLPYQTVVDQVTVTKGQSAPGSGASASGAALWQISYHVSALLLAVPPLSRS